MDRWKAGSNESRKEGLLVLGRMERRKGGRKEGRRQGSKESRKEGRKEGSKEKCRGGILISSILLRLLFHVAVVVPTLPLLLLLLLLPTLLLPRWLSSAPHSTAMAFMCMHDHVMPFVLAFGMPSLLFFFFASFVLGMRSRFFCLPC